LPQESGREEYEAQERQPVVYFAHDFRFSVTINAFESTGEGRYFRSPRLSKSLDDLIKSLIDLTGTRKVDFVAHSRGGW
jgi:hypothetical protein